MPPDSPDPFVLSSPEHFKALGHPVRHRLVNLLRQRSATLRQLAEALSVPKGTTAYHAGILQSAGILQVVETRRVRGGTEQYLGLVRDTFTFEDGTAGAQFLYRSALAEMLPERESNVGNEKGNGSGSGHGDGDGDGDGRDVGGGAEGTTLRHLWLSAEQARALQAALLQVTAPTVTPPAEEVTGDVGATGTAGPATPTGATGATEAYGLLISLYRADIPLLPPDEPGAESESSSRSERLPGHD